MKNTYFQSHLKSSANKHRQLADLRSFSSPDIKNLQKTESSSPYMSLQLGGTEDTDFEDSGDVTSSGGEDEDSLQPPLPPGAEDDSSSSTDTSSSIQIFTKPKTLKRAANRKMSNKLKDCLMTTSSVEAMCPGQPPRVSSSHSVYVTKHREALLANQQPPGFDRK